MTDQAPAGYYSEVRRRRESCLACGELRTCWQPRAGGMGLGCAIVLRDIGREISPQSSAPDAEERAGFPGEWMERLERLRVPSACQDGTHRAMMRLREL